MRRITLVQLRAIVGDEKFNSFMTPENIKSLINKGIRFKDFVEVDNKLANSYDVQRSIYDESIYAEDLTNIIHQSDGVLKLHSKLQLEINNDFWSEWLENKENQITKNPDGSIDFDGEVNIANKYISEIPVKFRNVDGDFVCRNNNLTSLENAPEYVSYTFDCGNNLLTSLKGAPTKVGEAFICHSNNLTSLEGCPQNITNRFNCSRNKLTNLKGGPQYVSGDYECGDNQLITLEGAPKEVGGSIYFNDNQLTNLKYAPQYVGNYFTSGGNPNLSKDEIEQYNNVLGNAKIKRRDSLRSQRAQRESYTFKNFYFKG